MLRARLSDPAAASDLETHLADQGFPATLTDAGELEILFPGPRTMFVHAAELDVWRARNADVLVTLEELARR